MELELLKIIEDLSLYNRFKGLIKRHMVSQETYIIFKDMEEYFSEGLTYVDWRLFSTWFLTVRHPSFKEEKKDIYKTILNSLHEMGDVENPALILNALIKRDFATRVATTASSIAEGEDVDTPLESLKDVLRNYETEVGKTDRLHSCLVSSDIDEIFDYVKGGSGFNWRLEELNLSCGPVRGGDFIIISSRPDTGKTTMLASEATYIGAQLEGNQRVLWFNNEEEGRKVKSRIYQACLGKEVDWIDENREKAQAGYISKLGRVDRIEVFDNKRMSTYDVEEMMKEFPETKLIVFDQLWKVRGFEKESTSDVDRLTRIFAWARELAAVYECTVLAVHQADATAHGQEYIEMNQLYYSKTGIQGEADAIITLGRDLEDPSRAGSRGLYVPKNKLVGGARSREEFRNGKFEIQIKPTIARFTGEF